MLPRIPRSTLIEVIIPATVTGSLQKTKFQFEGQLFSTGKKGKGPVYIKGMEAYSNELITSSPFTGGVPVASPTDIVNGLVTLSAQNDLVFDQVPIADMVRLRSGLTSTVGSVDLFRIDDWQDIDWTKCFITTIQAPLGPLPFSYVFNVYYDYKPSDF